MRLLLALVVLIGGREIAAGLLAYQEGRFEQAYEAFTAAVERAGDSAPAELLYDQALTAARLRNWVEMEAAAERAAAQGGAGFAARRDFLRGNAAFDRSRAAADRAAIGSASDWDKAIVLGEAARLSWQAAATSRPDWPEARRNVERAARRLVELRGKREAAKRQQGETPPKDPPPDAQPPPDAAPPDFEPPPELSPEELKELLERLAQQELDKERQRRLRRKRPGGAERDW